MHPLLDADRILGGFHTPTDGLVKAVRAVEAQAEMAIARGAGSCPTPRCSVSRTTAGGSPASGPLTG
jgi:glycine/D-amino acid oxidase-like deaminating enzyme